MIYNALNQIISKDVIIPVNHEKRSITIKESAPDAKLRQVVIDGFTDSDKFVAFRLEHKKIPFLSPYLDKSQKDIHKGCDAVIVTEINASKYIFFCELKSDHPKGYREQFLSSHAFVDYVDSISGKFFDSTLEGFKKIYLLFTSKRLNKQPLKAHRQPVQTINDIPFYLEGNFRRGDRNTPNIVNIKKYAR